MRDQQHWALLQRMPQGENLLNQLEKAKLALIPKGSENGTSRSLPSVRPICLLNDIGKAFERIIVKRIKAWSSKYPQAALSDNQYGFRKRKSTCVALTRVKAEVQRAVGNGGVVIAVSLNISNAFNSLPWPKIHKALRDKGFPTYIRRIMRGYLSTGSHRKSQRKGGSGWSTPGFGPGPSALEYDL